MEAKDVRYIFDTSVLKKGDILLINTYNERMHLLMKSQYDHVALYAGDAFIMESDGGTRCSSCKKKVHDTTDGGYAPVDLSEMPYCPKCGAIMDGD